MQALEALLRRFAKRANSRWWVGDRPDVRETHMAKAIAERVAYPTAKSDSFTSGGMIRLSRVQVAHVLAVAGTTSLAYGNASPSKGKVKEAEQALKNLSDDAIFLGNGLWEASAPASWTPLTSATFDCGVIGYDAENAFIFWVEEED